MKSEPMTIYETHPTERQRQTDEKMRAAMEALLDCVGDKSSILIVFADGTRDEGSIMNWSTGLHFGDTHHCAACFIEDWARTFLVKMKEAAPTQH